MSGSTDLPASGALLDQAVAWLVRVQSDAATADDWTALTLWLEASEAHQAAFDAAESLSAEIADGAPAILGGLRSDGAEVLTFRPRAARPRRWAPVLGAAAAAALALAVSPVLIRSYQGAPVVYQTRAGETRDIALADGSHIRLDAASKLTVRYGWRVRRVEMAQAQAAFDVAKDAQRPFIVEVGDQQVRVVGTEFNIRHLDGAVDVTVRRGVVEVGPATQSPGGVARLTVGDQLHHVEGADASARRRVDPSVAFAWTERRMICDDLPLSTIVADLNRRYAIPIKLSPQAGRRRFSGVLELSDQEALVRRLADYLSLTVRRTDREIILS